MDPRAPRAYCLRERSRYREYSGLAIVWYDRKPGRFVRLPELAKRQESKLRQ
jgi:hypothetical protein